MSIRTTLTLDEDLVSRLREESRARGVPFRRLLNEALRCGLDSLASTRTRKKFKIEPFDLGVFQGLNYDDIGSMIEVAEGERWR